MMNAMNRVFLALLIIGISGYRNPAWPYSSLVIFGDSLTDTGNAALRYFPGGIWPEPFAGGRLSNGPLWIEELAARLELPPPVPHQLGGFNYAWAGATTGTNSAGELDMNVQVQTYLQNHVPGGDELFVLWGGTNDFFFGQQNAAAPVARITDYISSLAGAGARNVLVVNLPRYFGNAPANSNLTPRTAEFNFQLRTSLASIRILFPQLGIFEFDYFQFFENVIRDAGAFGFSNVIDPACTDCVGWDGTPIYGVVPYPSEYYFWDDVHPTAAAHRLIGIAAHEVVSTRLPEPAGMSGLLLLAIVISLVRWCRFESQRCRT